MTARNTDLGPDHRPVKDARVNLRLTARQDFVIRGAAAARDTTVSEFILGTVVSEAERVLAEQRWFLLDDQAWGHLQELFDAPMPTVDERLQRLLGAPSSLNFIDQ